MILCWTSAAFAVPQDSAVTAIGAQGLYDQGIGGADLDPLISERLRWTLADNDQMRVLALVDARFTLDPLADDVWDQQRVRTVGVQIVSERWTTSIGRHPVQFGGPRLVDGLQVVHHAPDGGLSLGVWGGLAPDLFTTTPALRPGGGPIVAWNTAAVQASLVGEVLAAADAGGAFGLDRLGLLAQARLAPSRVLDLSGRFDGQLDDSGPALADASLFARVRPTRALTVDALYDAYSSVRYLQTGDLDPDLRRFSARLEALGVVPGLTDDLPDSDLYQLTGGGITFQGRGELAPRIAINGRYRHAALADDRFARVGPQLGLLGLAAGRLDATVDYVWSWRGDAGARQDFGLTLVLDPLADGRLTIDGSARLLLDPAFAGTPGYYADVFVDLLAIDRTALVAGFSATNEPSDVLDAGLMGFLWLQYRVERREP